jgi:5'-3' exonuclease
MADFVLFRGEHGDYIAVNPNEVVAVRVHRRDDPFVLIEFEDKDHCVEVESEFFEVVRRLRHPRDEKHEIEERAPVEPRERREERREERRDDRDDRDRR